MDTGCRTEERGICSENVVLSIADIMFKVFDRSLRPESLLRGESYCWYERKRWY